MTWTTLQKEVLEEVKTLVINHMNRDDVCIYLFGSWAKGAIQPSSDIDIAVDYKGALKAECLASLRDNLEDSTIPYNVDVVDLTKADSSFRTKVIKEGILWNDCFNDSKPQTKR
ncbi:type VII toxin-antitoxin system MntA family adenylyltransferase antitoxin [Bacillus sp. FJAT-44742]|uniref:type VII toxin-antitoxin system MntA family adenylyltransferase antitoxin n=1 Tax=Bacillus sp. FJAT-44742 TaxID=2014005 RepID=UPI000C241C41|nr:nucleotidyltransferase domain-containing protein [Bacillus sp. FJAT-44742]